MQWIHAYVGAVLCLLYTGVAFHRKKRIHVPIMITSFVLDMSAILYLELNRGVLAKVLEKSGTEHVLQIHLTFAVLTLLGYGVAFYTGSRLLKGIPIKRFHKINAMVFLISRTGVFITSFFVI